MPSSLPLFDDLLCRAEMRKPIPEPKPRKVSVHLTAFERAAIEDGLCVRANFDIMTHPPRDLEKRPAPEMQNALISPSKIRRKDAPFQENGYAKPDLRHSACSRRRYRWSSGDNCGVNKESTLLRLYIRRTNLSKNRLPAKEREPVDEKSATAFTMQGHSNVCLEKVQDPLFSDVSEPVSEQQESAERRIPNLLENGWRLLSSAFIPSAHGKP